MKINYFFLFPFLFTVFTSPIFAQTYIDSEGIEYFDVKKYKETNHYYYIRKEDGFKVSYLEGFGDKNRKYELEETPPKPNILLRIKKTFYKNGILASKETRFGDVLTGKSLYYNEKGKLIKEVDEDAKFGKIQPENILQFLDREAFINKETGETLQNMEGNKYRGFKVYFEPREKIWIVQVENGRDYTPREEEEIDKQRQIKNEDGTIIETPTSLYPDSYTYIYKIDGGTGEVISDNLALDPRDVFKTYKGKQYTEKQWKHYRYTYDRELLAEGEYFGDKEEPYPVTPRCRKWKPDTNKNSLFGECEE